MHQLDGMDMEPLMSLMLRVLRGVPVCATSVHACSLPYAATFHPVSLKSLVTFTVQQLCTVNHATSVKRFDLDTAHHRLLVGPTQLE